MGDFIVVPGMMYGETRKGEVGRKVDVTVSTYIVAGRVLDAPKCRWTRLSFQLGGLSFDVPIAHTCQTAKGDTLNFSSPRTWK